MSIASWLMGIGISAEKAAQQVGVRAGAIPLQWPAGQSTSVIYRLPRDPHKRASLFSTAQTIVVNEGESAVVLEDGKANGALEPGRYVFQKARVVGALDIVWIRTGQQSIKWGIGNLSSIDGIQISGRGMLYIRVDDANLFNSEVIQGAIMFSDVEMQRYLMPRVQSVVRTVIARLEARALMFEREVFSEAVRIKLGETFGKMGLKIVDLEVVEINLPPEYKAAIAQEAMVRATGTAHLLEAQQLAQVTQIHSVATAQAKLTHGMADVQVLAQLQAAGFDPLKLKAMEALQTMAANPSQGGGMIAGDMARAQLFGQVAQAALASPGGVGLQQPQPLPALSLQPPAATAPAPAQAAASDIARVEEQLDKLVERLAMGEISEDLFNKLAARLEAKLERMGG